MVHIGQQIQIVRLYALVHLVDGGVDRAELDHFGAGGGDKAPVRGAAGGEQGWLLAIDRLDGRDRRRQQFAGVGQERLAGEGPVQLVIQTVSIQ